VLVLSSVAKCSGIRYSLASAFEKDMQDEEEEAAGLKGCNIKQKVQFFERFKIGSDYGKNCSQEASWSRHIEYVNPESPKTFALYIYPMEDHNNAFQLCGADAKMFDGVTCKRLNEQGNHYSVQFIKVNSVEEATSFVRSLKSSFKIKHLVLGGHGSPTELEWGDGSTGTRRLSTNAASEVFLDAVYPHLLLGPKGSTVMLDACENGKDVDGDKNMVQHVAHRLAGAQVFGAKNSFSYKDFELLDSEHFNAMITDRNQNNKMVKLRREAATSARHSLGIQLGTKTPDTSATCSSFVSTPVTSRMASLPKAQ